MTGLKAGERTERRPIFLGPGEGRSYPMGRIAAVFKTWNRTLGVA